MKALPLTLALSALSIFAAGCGSNDQAQVRFVHAIQNAPTMDVDITGPTDVTPAPVFSAISFLGVLPNQPGYTSVPSGTDTIEGFLTGTTSVAFNSTALNLNGVQQYTLVATGLVASGQGAVILPVPDDTPTPASTDVAFRVINASPSGPNGTGAAVDVYILLNPATAPRGSPTFSGIPYQKATGYAAMPFNPNNDTTPPGFTMFVTPSGTTAPPFTIVEGINPATAGAVRTLVLTDVQDGKSMNSTFLELSDLN